MASTTLQLPLFFNTRWLSLNIFLIIILIVLSKSFVTESTPTWHCRKASNTIRAFCSGCYAGGLAKRQSTDIHPALQGPFVHKSFASSFLKGRTHSMHNPNSRTFFNRQRKSRGGFVDECCKRNCSNREMMLYCCEEQQRYWADFLSIDFADGS